MTIEDEAEKRLISLRSAVAAAAEYREIERAADWKRTYNAALPGLMQWFATIFEPPMNVHDIDWLERCHVLATRFADRAHGKLGATEEKSYPAASVERLAIAAANAQPHVSSRGVKRALFEALREFREIVEVPDEESP